MTKVKRPIKEKIFRFCSALLTFLQFVFRPTGSEYGLTVLKRFRLARRIIANTQKVRSLSTWRQHLVLVAEILSIPATKRGDVVECGCFNGASSINLSLACALANRTLYICDSFEGLPEPEANEKFEVQGNSTNYYVWEEGEFSSEGGVAAVRRNVEQYGDISVCRFVKGYFNESLPNLEAQEIGLVFEDADIVSSVKDCLVNLWPKMIEGSKFYCHEPWSKKVVALFFDADWWQHNLGLDYPGFFGSGSGTVTGLGYSSMGYALKIDEEKIRSTGTKGFHAGCRGFAE